MAGAIKHMERSRRSHHNKPNYTSFHRHANAKAASKQTKAASKQTKSMSLAGALKQALSTHVKKEGGN